MRKSLDLLGLFFRSSLCKKSIQKVLWGTYICSKVISTKNIVDWTNVLPKITEIQNIPYRAINSDIFYVLDKKSPKTLFFRTFDGLAPTLNFFPYNFWYFSWILWKIPDLLAIFWGLPTTSNLYQRWYQPFLCMEKPFK